MKDTSGDKDQMQWKWTSGAATTTAEFGTPTGTTGYVLCLYDGTTLISSTTIPAAGSCNGGRAGRATQGLPVQEQGCDARRRHADEAQVGRQRQGPDPDHAKGSHLEMPPLGAALTSPITVQLAVEQQRVLAGRLHPPFIKNDGVLFNGKAD